MTISSGFGASLARHYDKLIAAVTAALLVSAVAVLVLSSGRNATEAQAYEQRLDALLELVADGLPKPDVEVELLLPYDRGDLLSRVHEHGEVLTTEHTEAGTRVRAKVHAQAVAALAAYRV